MKKISFLTLFSILLFAACNKDTELIGDTTTDVLKFETNDSIAIQSFTIADKPANGKNLSAIWLGNTNDSRFGETKAAFFTQFSLSENDYELGNNAVLDSIVLVLKQTDAYGTLSAGFQVDVYELDHTLNTSDAYLNNTVLNLKSTKLASIANKKFDKEDESIRLKLNNTFGNTLLSAFGTSTMETTDNFKTFFKGIYVSAYANTGDGMVNVNLKNDESYLAMYYHSDSQTDTSFHFVVSSTDISVNQYAQNRTGTEVNNAVNDNNNNESLSYVSSMSGVKTVLVFPDLAVLKETIINKATLTVYQADYGQAQSAAFSEPSKLFLFQNLYDTAISFLPDFTLSNPTPFGGVKETVTINGQNTIKYTFNVTKYIQSLSNESALTKELYLATPSNNEANRIKIGGGSNANLPIHLEVLYTKKIK